MEGRQRDVVLDELGRDGASDDVARRGIALPGVPEWGQQ
jgi:hypothetical protein